MQSAAKENSFRYMRALSERLFLSTVREASTCEDGAHGLREFFCHFICLEQLNTHTCTAEKENTCNSKLDPGSS